MAIALKCYRLLYMALPKAGCTAVKAALAHIDPDAPEGLGLNAPMADLHRHYQTRRFRPHRFQAYEGWWRFCVIRDPVQRLLSVWSDKVHGRDELYNSRALRDGGSALPRRPDPDTFFENLGDYMRLSSAIRNHALPARLFIGSDLGAYDRVYTTASLDRLADDLGKLSGRAVRIARRNRSRVPLHWPDLGPAARRAVLAHTREDYAMMRRHFEPPPFDLARAGRRD